MHAVPARSSIGSVPCFGGDVSAMSVEHQLFVGTYEQEDEHLLLAAPSSPMCVLDVEKLRSFHLKLRVSNVNVGQR